MAPDSQPPGFRLALATAPHDLADVLDRIATAQDAVEDLGTRSVGGVEARRFAIAEGSGETQVWVGVEDGLIRRISFEHRAGSTGGGLLMITTVFDLYDHGVPTEIATPTGDVPLETVPLVHLPPFWIGPMRTLP